jgi:hypothetical protein
LAADELRPAQLDTLLFRLERSTVRATLNNRRHDRRGERRLGRANSLSRVTRFGATGSVVPLEVDFHLFSIRDPDACATCRVLTGKSATDRQPPLSASRSALSPLRLTFKFPGVCVHHTQQRQSTARASGRHNVSVTQTLDNGSLWPSAGLRAWADSPYAGAMTAGA